MKHALLAGLGGIGKNVYYPEIINLGYQLDVFDIISQEANIRSIKNISKSYDLAVICTPNFTHKEIADKLASVGTRRIFVEKPGLASALEWDQLCKKYPKTQFSLVKNNLYRSSYDNLLELFKEKDVVAVDINWLNKNRIPSPGSWFTNKTLSFGGVSKDLMPHIFCFALKLFGLENLVKADLKFEKHQRWNLSTATGTDYGTVNPAGIYDADDYARAQGIINYEGKDISLRMTASWKEGYDKQSVTLFFRDGTTYEWEFGLCPADAYGTMLEDFSSSENIDKELHHFLEKF